MILTKNIQLLTSAQHRLREDTSILQATTPPATKQPLGTLDYSWHLFAGKEAAWQTASTSGALALMPYREVQDYSYPYGQIPQDYVTALEFVRDMENAEAITRRADATHPLSAADRQKLLDLTASATGEATLLMKLYLFQQNSLEHLLHPPIAPRT
jgi:hypothetical protein